ncbi:hypothetical protein O181_055675 [Austropuccinia psidii MF-1]|uniref:Uncharacterized protein n=1 Tax=Austropuccinia psidii MF-1 TaxID=1389203 RepID=A0A9Q3EB80_9BASI|nr:hypothetical protein [Austropuccinia psidii MF-1]
MVRKAGNLCSRGQSKSLINQNGPACLHLPKEQHWYASCEVFLDNVDAGKKVAPKNLQQPAHFSNKGKKNKVFNVTLKGISNGVLVYSAAEIHVSGYIPDFIPETLLNSPPTLQLVSHNNTSKLTGMGRLWILNPSSRLELANVYYFPDI